MQILTKDNLESIARGLVGKRGKLITWELQITDSRIGDAVYTQIALVAKYTDRADGTVKVARGGI